MKIVLIHGQNHKGSTYTIGRQVADKLSKDVTEYFLPRDFGAFCVGCTNCFMKDEALCPHFAQLEPITKAMDEADVLIFTSPVYVYHVSGPLKSFLDHYGYRWMVHRPDKRMFSKQAVCISTAAGAGMKSTIKDIADSLFFWGIPVVYKYGIAVRATSYEMIKPQLKKKINQKTTLLASKIKKKYEKKKFQPGVKTKALFYMMRMMQRFGWNEADTSYWKKQGWTGKNRPWK